MTGYQEPTLMRDAVATASDGSFSEAALLRNYSVELISQDTKSLSDAPTHLPPGTEVFVAARPNEKVDNIVGACARLHRAGFSAVPHIVARNVPSAADLDDMLGRLANEAGVDTCLVLGGDKEKASGPFSSSLEILETHLLPRHGIRDIRLGCYPEGHPRIYDQILADALAAKVRFARAHGHRVTLVSQFVFAAEPVIAFARKLRESGIHEPFRVGVAGPANRKTLLRYAMLCGVGASVRVLKNRSDLAKGMLAGETPAELISDLAAAVTNDPGLGISGIHFFTFGNLANSANWASAQLEARS